MRKFITAELIWQRAHSWRNYEIKHSKNLFTLAFFDFLWYEWYELYVQEITPVI